MAVSLLLSGYRGGEAESKGWSKPRREVVCFETNKKLEARVTVPRILRRPPLESAHGRLRRRSPIQVNPLCEPKPTEPRPRFEARKLPSGCGREREPRMTKGFGTAAASPFRTLRTPPHSQMHQSPLLFVSESDRKKFRRTTTPSYQQPILLGGSA